MHALVEDVLPYLVVFYLVDSLVLVRASEWALLAPWQGFRVERSGLHLAGLSPFAEAAGLFVPPLLLGPEGVVLLEGSPAPTEASFVRFDALGKVAADGPAVRLAGRRVATPALPAARRLAATLRALAAAPSHERPARLSDAFGGKADFEHARERRRVVLRLGRPCRWLGIAQLGSWRGVLKAAGTSLEQVLEAPASLDPAAALYCPLCASEYRAGFSTCSDCGVALRGLAT